jgi:hypothetical protein
VPDLLDQLERYAAAAQDAVRTTHPVRPRRGSPRLRRRAAGLLAAAVVAAALVLALVDDADRRTDVQSEPPPSAPPSDGGTSSTGSDTTVAATSTHRLFPVTAFTGREYLVWSGEAGSEEAVRADGFAVDVETGAVRAIPPAPIVARSGATGVWTGTSLIVCCGTGTADGYGPDTRSAAAWDPATGAWETLATPPASVARSYPTSVWTGELMVVMATGPAVATYHPATDTWAEVVAPPRLDRTPTAIWTGEEVVLWDSRYGPGIVAPPTPDVADEGWRWAPGRDEWLPLPPLPEGSRTRLGGMAWTGQEVVVWGQAAADETQGAGARWRPGDDEWRPISASPRGPVADPYNGTPGSQALAPTGDGSVAIRDIDADLLYLYDPDTDRWTETRLALEGWNPLFGVYDGRVLVPDEADPILGGLP